MISFVCVKNRLSLAKECLWMNKHLAGWAKCSIILASGKLMRIISRTKQNDRYRSSVGIWNKMFWKPSQLLNICIKYPQFPTSFSDSLSDEKCLSMQSRIWKFLALSPMQTFLFIFKKTYRLGARGDFTWTFRNTAELQIKPLNFKTFTIVNRFLNM